MMIYVEVPLRFFEKGASEDIVMRFSRGRHSQKSLKPPRNSVSMFG